MWSIVIKVLPSHFRDGRLQKGDELVNVSGARLRSLSPVEAHRVLEETPLEVDIVVGRALRSADDDNSCLADDDSSVANGQPMALLSSSLWTSNRLLTAAAKAPLPSRRRLPSDRRRCLGGPCTEETRAMNTEGVRAPSRPARKEAKSQHDQQEGKIGKLPRISRFSFALNENCAKLRSCSFLLSHLKILSY